MFCDDMSGTTQSLFLLRWQFQILGMHMILILAFLKELLLLGK